MAIKIAFDEEIPLCSLQPTTTQAAHIFHTFTYLLFSI